MLIEPPIPGTGALAPGPGVPPAPCGVSKPEGGPPGVTLAGGPAGGGPAGGGAAATLHGGRAAVARRTGPIRMPSALDGLGAGGRVGRLAVAGGRRARRVRGIRLGVRVADRDVLTTSERK